MPRTFKWQINSSAAGKLLGYFGRVHQEKALAECWYMNIKRMPRFNVTPAERLTQKPVAEVVQEQIASKPEFKQMVENAIAKPQQQQKMTANIEEVAKEDVVTTKRKYSAAVEKLKVLSEIKAILKFNTKKAGVRRAPIKSYFSANGRIYHKTSRATAKLSSVEEAIRNGYQPETKKAAIVAAAASSMTTAKKEATVAVEVAKRAKTAATRVINTTRGIRKELSDLELVQCRVPNVRAGNDRAYFLQLRGQPWGAFVIGRIDGQSPSAVYELKHRQSRLFHELRRYEQVQCILYMKMTKISHLFLVETYMGEQVYYEMTLTPNGLCRFRQELSTGWSPWKDGFSWCYIKKGLENIVSQLNKAESDSAFREELKSKLY